MGEKGRDGRVGAEEWQSVDGLTHLACRSGNTSLSQLCADAASMPTTTGKRKSCVERKGREEGVK